MRSTVVFLLILALFGPAMANEEAQDDPLAQARALLDTPRHEEGVAALRKLIHDYREAEPDLTKLVHIGQAHYLLDEDEDAVKALQKAVAFDPKSAWAHIWLGMAWRWVDPTKAAAPLREAVRLDPEYGAAWYQLALVLKKQGEDAAALEAILKALEHGIHSARAHFTAGLLLCRAGRFEEGTKHYEKLVKQDPKHASARYNLGVVYFDAGRHEDALVLWREAAALDAKDLYAHAKVVKALTALGRHDEAAIWREKVFAIYDASEDEETKELRTFGFDEFEVDDVKVTVREILKRGKDQLYATIFYVEGPDDLEFRINLEPHGAYAWLGGAKYVLGRSDGPSHTTYDIEWMERPSYPDLKKAVIKAIRDKLAARSRSHGKEGTVEINPK